MLAPTLTLAALAEQVGEAFQRLPPAEQARRLALARQVTDPGQVALDVRETAPAQWSVAVSMADALGALSILAGLFTAYRLDILRAEIVTIRLPRPGPVPLRFRPGRAPSATPGPSRLLLDVFEVRAVDPPPPELWEQFHAELRSLVSLLVAGRWEEARNAIIDRVSEVFRLIEPPEARLLPVRIEVVNEPGASTTCVRVRSVDTVGFLFSFTNALAGFTINIERAEVRSEAGEAIDTFWVTDRAGHPLTGERQLNELRVATALIKQFTHLLPRSPDPGQALRQFSALIREMLSRPERMAELGDLESPAVLETLAELMGVSRFLWEDFLRLQHENLFPVLVDRAGLDQPRSREELARALAQHLAEAADRAARVEALNAFKDREMFRIDLRHITGRSDFVTFSQELTALAEVALTATLDLCEETLRQRYGTPLAEAGQPSPWAVAALGKFGGAEIGFGSDLELVLVYAHEGETSGPQRVRTSQFYAQLVLLLKETLRARQDGIFQLDLRLRPHGEGGALASSLAGFASYYRPGGGAEQFERMALVKLRPVAGDPALGAQVMALRDAFVYSGEPLDWENIRHLRSRQATELVARGELNAKYSPGGLVDVEYFVQAWQILVGAHHPSVRVTNTLLALERLQEVGALSAELVAEIELTYRFLRRLIDALRVVRGNAKDLTLPPVGTREHAYLAHRLGFASSEALASATSARMAFARSLWTSHLPKG
ncbi:MAG: hypothetical protein KatS3mg061_2085 [Dehalococcoidia bacterium]|nr:MAG: hypothetical protein KatS3mg061_2085 [Dehalococcoidia bacterium]